MNTLSDKLTDLYRPLWSNLFAELQSHGKKTQYPFLLAVARHEKDSCNWVPKYEEWYTKADLKVMIFGQEPHNWVKDEKDDNGKEDLDFTQRAYEEFFENKYVLTEQGGFWSHDEIAAGNHFFRWGCNGIMSGIVDQILKPNYPGKKVSMLWNNISKLSTMKGGPVDGEIHAIEREFFHVIPKEIEILKPDIIVFLTGPGENDYYGYILENFHLKGEPSSLGNIPVHDLAKLPLEGVKLAYKTYHPNAYGKDESFHWQFYQAILDDIKTHLGEIIK